MSAGNLVLLEYMDALVPSIHVFLKEELVICKGFTESSVGKESACNVGDLGLIPGLGRSPGEGKATHSSILAWRIPWTIQSMGSQRVRHD